MWKEAFTCTFHTTQKFLFDESLPLWSSFGRTAGVHAESRAWQEGRVNKIKLSSFRYEAFHPRWHSPTYGPTNGPVWDERGRYIEALTIRHPNEYAATKVIIFSIDVASAWWWGPTAAGSTMTTTTTQSGRRRSSARDPGWQLLLAVVIDFDFDFNWSFHPPSPKQFCVHCTTAAARRSCCWTLVLEVPSVNSVRFHDEWKAFSHCTALAVLD